jgi:hypothetical protein
MWLKYNKTFLQYSGVLEIITERWEGIYYPNLRTRISIKCHGSRTLATRKQCCGAGAARSRNFWPELECQSFGSGSVSAKVVNKNKNSYCIESSMWIRLIFFHKKNMKNPLSVIKGSYNVNVEAGAGSGARAGAGAKTFWKSEPEWKQKVSAHNTARKQMGNSCSAAFPKAADQQLDSNKLVLAATIKKLLLSQQLVSTVLNRTDLSTNRWTTNESSF